jgi:hypothetical protein
MDMKKVVMTIALLGCASPFGMAFCADAERDVGSTTSEEQKPEQQPLPEEPTDESSK